MKAVISFQMEIETDDHESSADLDEVIGFYKALMSVDANEIQVVGVPIPEGWWANSQVVVLKEMM